MLVPLRLTEAIWTLPLPLTSTCVGVPSEPHCPSRGPVLTLPSPCLYWGLPLPSPCLTLPLLGSDPV